MHCAQRAAHARHARSGSARAGRRSRPAERRPSSSWSEQALIPRRLPTPIVGPSRHVAGLSWPGASWASRASPSHGPAGRVQSLQRSLCGPRTLHLARRNARPVEALHKRRQLRSRQPHHAVLDARPTKLAAFQTLRQKAEAGAVPPQELHPVGALGPEYIDSARERVSAECLLHQRSEAVGLLAEVHRLRRHQDLRGAGSTNYGTDHARPRSAFSTVIKARGSASPRTRTITPPSAISIGAGATPAALIDTAAGKAAAADDRSSSSTMAGTNAGVASDDGAEPFTASRKCARQPNSCCGLRP